MKSLLLFFCCCLFSLYSQSQTVALHFNSYANKAILCLPNSISVAVEGLKANSILLKTNNGSIERDIYHDSKSNYLFYPKTSGRTMIYVYKKTKTPKLIDSIVIYVERIPVNKPRFANVQGGLLTQWDALFQIGLDAQMAEHYGKFIITNYTISVTRQNAELLKRMVSGSRIDSISHEFFYNLQNGDSLAFKEIAIRDCDSTIRYLPSIAFAITDAYEYQIINGVTDTVIITNPITGADEIRIQNFRRERRK